MGGNKKVFIINLIIKIIIALLAPARGGETFRE